MRTTPLLPLKACLCAGLFLAFAAGAQGRGAARSLDPGVEPGPQNPTIERIRIEDKGTRIDELRVGGQTQSITVQPKNDMPAYEVRPAGATGADPAAGARVWNLRKF